MFLLLSAHNQYSQALKYYLQAGVVSTDFFSEPITKNVYDETVRCMCVREVCVQCELGLLPAKTLQAECNSVHCDLTLHLCTCSDAQHIRALRRKSGEIT